MDEINGNQIASEIGMLDYIKNNPNLNLRFVGTAEAFRDNLDMIELTMEQIFGCAVLVQIGYYGRAASNKTADIVNKLAEFKYGEGRKQQDERTFSDFTEDSVKVLLNNAGFEILECGVSADIRPGRADEKRVNVIARKI